MGNADENRNGSDFIGESSIFSIWIGYEEIVIEHFECPVNRYN